MIETWNDNEWEMDEDAEEALDKEYLDEETQQYKQEIERLNRTNNEIFKANETLAEEIKKLQNQLQQKENIIKEVRKILKFHLSNPSGTKNGWHIDIWNNEDISKLNEDLGILDKGE